LASCRFIKLNAVHILQRRLPRTGLQIYKSLKELIGGRDSVVGISTSRGLKPAEGVVRDFVLSAPVQTGRGIHPASRTMDTGALTKGQSGRGVALTSDPHVETRLRMSTAEPLLPPVSPLAMLWGDLHLYMSLWTTQSNRERYIHAPKCDWKPQSQPQVRRPLIHRPTSPDLLIVL